MGGNYILLDFLALRNQPRTGNMKRETVCFLGHQNRRQTWWAWTPRFLSQCDPPSQRLVSLYPRSQEAREKLFSRRKLKILLTASRIVEKYCTPTYSRGGDSPDKSTMLRPLVEVDIDHLLIALPRQNRLRQMRPRPRRHQ